MSAIKVTRKSIVKAFALEVNLENFQEIENLLEKHFSQEFLLRDSSGHVSIHTIGKVLHTGDFVILEGGTVILATKSQFQDWSRELKEN